MEKSEHCTGFPSNWWNQWWCRQMLAFSQARYFAKCCSEGSQGVFSIPSSHPHFLSIPSSPRLFSVSRIPNQFEILNSRISPSFCFKILDPGLQIRQIPNDKKPLWGALCSGLVNNAANSSHNSLKTLLVLTQTHLYDLLISILNSWIFKNLSVLFQ